MAIYLLRVIYLVANNLIDMNISRLIRIIMKGMGSIMKIANINNFTSYNSNLTKVKKKDTEIQKKYDVIQINKNNSISNESNNSFNIDQLKNKIVDEIKNESKAGRLEFLKQQINDNKYVVDADELARIMLDL